MASRHDIIHIDFQANAGKANAALEALRQESAKAKAEVDRLTKELQQKKAANFPLADIQTLEAELKRAKNVHRQWQDALNNNLKGVRALDEAVKMFNKGQGSVEGMNAALSKTAKNAAELQKSRSQQGSQTWNEMVALSKALEQNILSCNTATNQLVTTVKNGGSVSRATLTQAKSDLQQMLALENEGTSAWKKYNAQLKVVDGALTKMTVEQQQLAGKNVLAQVFRGDYITKSRSELEQMIAKLREYQSVIADPEGKGARHFNATKDAITKLSEQLQKTKGDAMNAQQAMKLAGMAGVDAKGAQFVAQQTKQKASVQQLTETLKQQQAQRANLVAQQQAEANASNRNIERFQNEANAIRAEVSALDMSTEAVARRKAELASVSAELEKQQQKEQKLQEQYAKTAAANQTSQRGVAVSNQLFTTQKEITSLSQKQATLQKEVEIVNRLREAENRLAGAQQMSTVETEKGTVVTKDYLTHLQMEVDRAKAEAASIDTSTEAMKRRKAELQTLGVQISQAQQKEKQLQDQYDRMAAHGRKGQKISKGIESTKNEIAALQQRKAVLETQISADARLQAAEEKVATAMQQAAGVAAMSGAAISHYDSQIASTTSQLNNEKTALDNLNKAENMTLQEVSQAIAVLKQEQEVTASTTAKFTEQANAIAVLEEREKIMRGEAISLADAMKLASTAGGVGFKGTATQLQQAEAALQKAVTTAKKGSPEWTKYSEALAKVRLEMQNTGMTSERMRTILNKPVNAKNLNELQAAVKRAKAELDLMAGTVGRNSKAYTDLANKTKQAEMQLKAMQAQSKGTASAFDKAWSRLKTYIGLYVGAAVAMQKIVATMGDLMELSDKMGEVRKTTGFTADEVGRLTTNLARIDTRSTLVQLEELAASAGQLGLKTTEDVEGFTIAANKLMVALPEMGREGATQMLKVALATGEIDRIRKQMQDGTVEGSSAVAVAMEKVGSTIDRLRASSASAAPAITDFVQRVGAVGAQSGISIDQIAALGSTVDALGMRVEMSATALSRMIPAIKNNAFDIAKAIGVTPDTLRNLFETGRGMEAILMIFQRIKDSGMDADSIENMLGMGNMKEIMKELNQQGARAGIVFAGLSQNVDELRRQLGVASQAYEENIAIQQEYNKMNETTAAKWERLKNRLEEMFVGDTGQRWLGGIIDALRDVVELLAGDSGVSIILRSILVYMGLVKLQIISIAKGALVALGSGLKNIGVMLGFIKGEMTAIQWGNIFTALIAAVWLAVDAFQRARDEATRLKEDLNRLKDEEDAAVAEVNRLITALNDSASKSEAAGKKHEELAEKTEALRKDVEELKKETNLSAEATETLNMKEGELKASEEKLKEASDEMNKANNTRLQLISEINSKYSTYLGYMLSEKTAAEQVASAHQLIIAALKEEMIQKSMNRRQDAINNIYDKQLQDYSTESENELRGIPLQSQQRIMDNFRRVLTSISYNAGTRTYSRFAVEGLSGEASGRSEEQLRGDLRVLLRKIVQQEVADKNGKITNSNLWARGIQNIDDYINSIWGGFMDDGFGTWVDTYMSREAESAKAFRDVNIESETAHKHSVESAVKDIESNANAITQIITDNQKLTDDNIRMLAQHANAVTANLQNYEGEIADVEKYMGKGKDVSLANAVETLFADLDATTRKRILTVAQKQGKVGTPGTGTGDVSTNITSPWGAPPEATSTDYASWDVLELVARRNQMNKFKNVLKPGVDVKAVLAEDKALMKAFEGREVTWEEALKWYNQERLKIQQELKSERFSTNEGNWRDEATKKGRKRVNPLAESDYALAELDRYYSRRKEALEKAREQENMSEELYNRQVELLEQEHLERRSKLRATFTEEVSKDEIKAFRQWWANLEKQDELDNVPWSTVESEWSKATAAQIGRNNLRMQQDLTKQREITVKHLNAIADIIAKERPYDGITQNLQANLTKMDILLADMLDTSKYTPAEMVNEANKRLSFLLGESEKAYALTAEQLMADMGEKGFKAWADALTSDENGEELTRQLLAQLQKTYDAVQEAIKKEASLIKKQVEIQWNNTKTPSGQSQKQMYEGALSALGLMEDQVKRANQLIGAGYASERVADKLAIKQMQIRLAMQAQYYNLIRKTGEERIAQLQAQGKLEDAEHLKKSLDLSLSEEQKKLDEQRVAIQNQLEESQNRLYKELKSWAEMIGASLQSVFEASHAGDKEYYNERAKLDLTGKGGPGAGTYIIIDNEGTSDAKAHYEYLDEREALERQREIERQNALADAWRKVMDDINMKMSETITDQVNAMMQNQSIDANTQAVIKNTEALAGMTSALGEKGAGVNIPSLAGAGNLLNGVVPTGEGGEKNETGVESGAKKTPVIEVEPLQNMEWEGSNGFSSTSPYINPNQEGADFWQWDGAAEAAAASAASQVDSINKVQTALDNQFHQQLQGTKDTNDAIKKNTQSMFASMTAAANLYGVAYQAMSNDNLDTSQKFQMIALQAAGNAAISGLTAALASDTAETTSSMPAILAKCLKIDPIWGSVLFGALTATLGGLMGLATSKIAKSKSTIAQVTGASASAGRLATGMLTYAEGNVNEFSDPKSLTPGRMYDVDAADGHTYRARYMGDKPRTHLTNGPEFHLSGEKGREMIIDAGTTRQITMNEGEIWRAIQTLSGGGRLRHSVRRGRGMANFADGNVEEFEEMENGSGVTVNGSGFSLGMMTQMQASLDRNSEVLERALREGFKGVFDVYGKGGLVDSYDTGKRTVNRYGERY